MNYRIMLICELIFHQIANEQIKNSLPTPDKCSFCFLLVHGYLGNIVKPTLCSLEDFDCRVGLFFKMFYFS